MSEFIKFIVDNARKEELFEEESKDVLIKLKYCIDSRKAKKLLDKLLEETNQEIDNLEWVAESRNHGAAAKTKLIRLGVRKEVLELGTATMKAIMELSG